MRDIPEPRLLLAHVVAYPDAGLPGRQRCREWISDPRRPGIPPDLRWASATGGPTTAVEVRLETMGWRWIHRGHEEFPPELLALSDPPLGLFVRGRLPSGPCAAVVGSRLPSAYGREVADHLGRELASAGVWVVSGMARGVDACAHRGALAGGGGTVAVWGAGPDRVYPQENKVLAESIAAAGGLMTEYPPGSPPRAHHFPERNRLIAGLARVVVVVEADEKSGALTTARLALDEGREVMAVPGSIFSRLSAGPNTLIRAGAAPVLSASDVLAALGVEPSRAGAARAEPGELAGMPPGEPFTVDHLAARFDQPVARVLERLLLWELAGWVAREPDGRFRRTAPPGHR